MEIKSNSQIKYIENNPWMSHFSGINGRLRSGLKPYRNIKNFLTKEDVKKIWFRDKAYLLVSPSIDRIDSKKHYSNDNCRFIDRSLNCSLSHKKRTSNLLNIFYVRGIDRWRCEKSEKGKLTRFSADTKKEIIEMYKNRFGKMPVDIRNINSKKLRKP